MYLKSTIKSTEDSVPVQQHLYGWKSGAGFKHLSVRIYLSHWQTTTKYEPRSTEYKHRYDYEAATFFQAQDFSEPCSVFYPWRRLSNALPGVRLAV